MSSSVQAQHPCFWQHIVGMTTVFVWQWGRCDTALSESPNKTCSSSIFYDHVKPVWSVTWRLPSAQIRVEVWASTRYALYPWTVLNAYLGKQITINCQMLYSCPADLLSITEESGGNIPSALRTRHMFLEELVCLNMGLQNHGCCSSISAWKAHWFNACKVVISVWKESWISPEILQRGFKWMMLPMGFLTLSSMIQVLPGFMPWTWMAVNSLQM